MNDKVIMYTKLPTPKEQFEKAMKYMEDIQGSMSNRPAPGQHLGNQVILLILKPLIFSSIHC